MKAIRLDKFSLFDNFWLVLLFFFLPFNYALTLTIGFPLKISEICIFILCTIAFLFTSPQSFRFPDYQITRILLYFTILVSVSVVVNLVWPYGYELKTFPVRLSQRADSLLKYFYFIIDVLVFLISYYAFKQNRKKYLKWWLYGSIVAAVYSFYLTFSSFFDLPVLLLWGMDELPQSILLGSGKIIRCGTFKEGNYMGVYLLICFIVAKFQNRRWLSLFFFLSIFTTFSSVAIITGLLFLTITFFRANYTNKRLPLLLTFLGFMVISGGIAFQNEGVRLILIQKLTAETENINNNSYSKADRENSVKVSLKETINNPLLGVGLGNYGLHYDRYNAHTFFTYENFRPIPNNIYMEVLSETGICGFLLFITFLVLLFRISKYDSTKILRTGLFSLYLCFFAFPTFTVIFIWVFFGLILSFKNEQKSDFC